MSAGLFALLDDVAVIARAAAASVDDVAAAAGRATAKAAGVVVDDTAVTPQYIHGVTPKRELPIIGRIAKGSLRNKLLIILPVALVLSQWFDWLLTPILMLGGSYLVFEGAHKIWGKILGQSHHDQPVTEVGPEAEKTMVSGAIRTDLILSAEIMVISLNEIAGESFWSRLVILAVVAIIITAVVYGVVALIVKMDDIGLHLAETNQDGFKHKFGKGLVQAMPGVLNVITVVGTVAMLWVGGHILLGGLEETGLWEWPYHVVHDIEHAVHEATGALGGALGWLVNTFFSAVLGFIVGTILFCAVQLIGRFVPRRQG